MKILKTKTKVFVISVILFSLLSISSAFFAFYSKNKFELTYKEICCSDYSVLLKGNDFYDKHSLGEGMVYVAALVDKISMEFKYILETNKNTNQNCKVKVEGELLIFEKDKPSDIIFNKKEMLLEQKNYEDNSSKKHLQQEKVEVEYEKYKDFVQNFKNTYNLLAEGTLKVTFSTEAIVDFKEADHKVNTGKNITVGIPIGGQTLNINETGEKDYDPISVEMSTNSELTFIGIILSCIFGILTLLFLALVILKFKKSKEPKSKYQRKIDKILKNYEKLIVLAKNPLKIKEEDFVVDVTNFTELIDTSDRLGKQIIFSKSSGKSCFIVKDRNDFYRFTIEESSSKDVAL